MAQLIQQIYRIPARKTPRNDLVEIFLSGITDKSGDEINLGPFNSQLDNADVRAKRFQPSEQLRLNMSVPVSATPSRLGVFGGDLQGFPNGRRLADDVVDISVQAVEGAVRTGKIVEPLAAGDKDVNDRAFANQFPYVAGDAHLVPGWCSRGQRLGAAMPLLTAVLVMAVGVGLAARGLTAAI